MSAATARRDGWERRLTLLSLLACVTLFLFHFSLVWRYAVDVPFWDEWSMFGPEQLPAGFSLRSISAQHLEHRFATTKLLIWSQYAWNGWDIAVHQRSNFLLFGVLLVTIGNFVKRALPNTPWWVILVFLPFVLSPINWMNHIMAYQTSTHLYVLFVLLATWLIFDPTATNTRLLLGGLVCALATFTSAAGAAASLAIGALFVAHELGSTVRRESPPLTRRALRLAAVILPVAFAVGVWLLGYRHADFPAVTLPTTILYWNHFLGIVALGFGIAHPSPIAAALLTAAVLLPLLAGLRLPSTSPAAPVAALALLAGAAAISLGRASFGVAQASSSRYAEYLLPLIPMTAAGWYCALTGDRAQQLAAVGVFWLICSLTFADDWRSFRLYEHEARRRSAGLACVERYYAGDSEGVCPMIFPADFPGGLAPFLDSARNLNASFYRKMVVRGREE